MIITNLKELEERKTLQHEDVVKFIIEKEEKIEYKVCWTHLWDKNWGENGIRNNNKIFEILKINKNKIIKEAYGYYPINHNNHVYYFSEYKHDDFPAITRLVKELYKIIEKKYTSFTRFEIMEI